MSERKSCGCGHKHDGMECAGVDAARQNIVKQIDAGHWAVMGIFSDDSTPYHTFSVGLFENFDHPEILIFGIHPHLATLIINEIGARVAHGRKLEPGRVYDDIIVNYGAVLIPVDKDKYDGYLGSALWYYQRDDFPVLQLVWPDPDGKFPWEEGYDTRYAAAQPLLGYVPDNAAELHGRIDAPDESRKQGDPGEKDT